MPSSLLSSLPTDIPLPYSPHLTCPTWGPPFIRAPSSYTSLHPVCGSLANSLFKLYPINRATNALRAKNHMATTEYAGRGEGLRPLFDQSIPPLRLSRPERLFFSRSEMERTRTRRLQAVRHGTGGRESHLDIYGNSTVGKLDGWYLAIVF